MNTSFWIGGQAYFDTLDPKFVAMLHETGRDAGLYSQQVAQDSSDQILADMEASGVAIIRPDLAHFREAAKAVYDEFPEWSKGLYGQIEGLIDEQGS